MWNDIFGSSEEGSGSEELASEELDSDKELRTAELDEEGSGTSFEIPEVDERGQWTPRDP